MKELITGQSGFIGNHLAEHLVQQGHEVKKVSFRGVAYVEEIHSFRPDHIFHLAAYGSQSGEKSVEEMVSVNVFQVLNLILAAKELKSSLILVGSSSEYGESRGPMSENTSLRPENLYGATKAAMAMIGRGFAKEQGLPIVTARPFSVYGPQERDARFIPTVIRSCLQGEPMKLCPEQNHDWIYVDDFVEGLLTCADYADQLKGEAVNFGTGIQVDNQAVVEVIQELLGKKANITERLLPKPQDSKVWVADIFKARNLGWEPKMKLVKGLEKTIEYYKELYGS